MTKECFLVGKKELRAESIDIKYKDFFFWGVERLLANGEAKKHINLERFTSKVGPK